MTTRLLLLSLFLFACTPKYLAERYTAKLGDVGADIAMHGIEIECFKYENHRWPNSFGEMTTYQARVLPCIGLTSSDDFFWKEYPTALIQGVDEANALIIIKEKRGKDGKLFPLEKELHINYTIDYQRSFSRVEVEE